MVENNTIIDVKSLITNILLSNIQDINIIKSALMNIQDNNDLMMLLLALDLSDLHSIDLYLIKNQFKNVLLEQYLNDNQMVVANKSIATCNPVLPISNMKEMMIEDSDYNASGAPVDIYGQESVDGFIYIDGRHAMPYEPLTEEKALKFVFLEKKLLPPAGSKGHIDQRFEYITDDGDTRLCIRRFVIDHEGHVVKFLGENTKPVNRDNPLIDDDKEGYNTGTLADLLNINDDNEE